MKEAYCSFEVAKLLKEKGFDEECHHVYDGEDIEWANILYGEDVLSNSEIADDDVISAPTHQMAMAWLREKYDIIIIIEPHTYDYVNSKTSSYVFCLWCGDNYEEPCEYSNVCGISYNYYEEAVEAALKYALENLIEEEEK